MNRIVWTATLVLLACCSLAPAQTRITPGQNVQAAINAAPAGSTILIDPGTYSLADMLILGKPLTLRASGAGVILQVPTNTFAALQVVSSDVTVEGLSLRNGCWGIFVSDFAATHAQFSNIRLSGLTVDTTFCPSTSPGHGIYLANIQNSAITDTTVVKAYANGIMLDFGSNGNLIANNTVQQTQTQHGIALKNSNHNVVAGNRVTGAGFFSVIGVGASNNRIDGNHLTGDMFGGITITDNTESGRVLSAGNAITRNIVVSPGFAAGRSDGTGIWLNNDSNGSLVFANLAEGAVENGISSFFSSYNYIAGNTVRRNGQGGFFVNGVGGARPQRTYLHQNIHEQPTVNFGIQIRSSDGNDVAYNTVHGISFETTTNSAVYRNTNRDVTHALQIYGDVTGLTYFQNRHWNARDKYVLSPAGAALDAGPVVGGNWWSDFTPNGNPSQGTPYRNIIYNGTTGATNGPYADNYPYQSETFGKTQSVAVLKPYGGQVAGAGTIKTIQWNAEGCVLVDLAYRSAATGLQTIAANYPNTGFYQWTVPTQASPDYSVRVTCKSTSGAVGVSGESDIFTVANAGLAVLAPTPQQRVSAGSAFWVSWRNSGAGAVNVFLRAGTSGGWTQVATNVTANAVRVNAPGTPSNRVSVLVQAAGNAAIQDSLDGFLQVRGGAGSFQVVPSGSAQVGKPVDLEWISPDGSQIVDLEFFDTDNQVARPVAIGLADYGFYRWLPPDLGNGRNGYLRATFRTLGGATVGTAAQTASIRLVYNDVAVTPGGLGFVPVTPCRLADTRNTSVMAGNTTRTFNVAGLCGIPSSARAYSLNVTVVPQTGNLAFLTLYPTGQSQPLASTLNSPQGLVVANAALVPAGNGGAVNVYVTDATHVVLDINGYFDSGASALPFFALTPCRIADTRNSGPILGNGETRNFALAGACGLPGSAAAYSLNVTAVPTGFLGFLSMFPTGQALPPVSTLNSADGRVVANAALVPAGSNGAVSAYVTNSSHVVLDTNGYFGRTGTGSPLLFYPLTPCRVADTRTAGGVLQPGARAFSMTAQSACGVPASARAVSLNVTVVPQTSFLGFLSIWPADQSQPLVSTLNSPRGAIVANAAIVPISTAGAVNVYVTDPAHVVLDVNGYFAP